MNQWQIHYSIHQGSIHPGLHLGGSPGGCQDTNLPNCQKRFTPHPLDMPNNGGSRISSGGAKFPGGPPKSANANGCGSDDLKFPDQSIKLWSNFFSEVHHGGQRR